MTGMPWGWCFQLCWLQVIVNHSVFWCPFADGFVSESLGLFDRWSLSNPAKHYAIRKKWNSSCFMYTAIHKNTHKPNSASHWLKTRTDVLAPIRITSRKFPQLCFTWEKSITAGFCFDKAWKQEKPNFTLLKSQTWMLRTEKDLQSFTLSTYKDKNNYLKYFNYSIFLKSIHCWSQDHCWWPHHL